MKRLILLCLASCSLVLVQAADLKLVDVAAMDSTIVLDIRYATPKNFTGKTVYPSARCLLREDAARRLERVQQDLKSRGYGLKIYDGYRPVAVQKIFWRILADERYVADPAKGSRHNRGAAVDVGLVDSAGRELPMPSGYDDFSETAHRNYQGAPAPAIANSRLLEEAMVKQAFEPMPTEWWHFDAPGWNQYPVSDRPLWTVSPVAVSVAASAAGPALAGFYLAQDYGLLGDVDVRFIVAPDSLSQVSDGNVDVAVVDQKEFLGYVRKQRGLVALAVIKTRSGKTDRLFVAAVRRDRRGDGRIRKTIEGASAGDRLASFYPVAAAVSVVKRAPELTFEYAQARVATSKSIKGKKPELPVRSMYPPVFAVAGGTPGLYAFAVGRTGGMEQLLDAAPVVVKTERPASVLDLLQRGLVEFGFIEAGQESDLPDDMRAKCVKVGSIDDRTIIMCPGRETPDIWMKEVFAVLARP